MYEIPGQNTPRLSTFWRGCEAAVKSDRLFRILYILLERQTVTAPELAALLEVSVRTVYRDIESLSMTGIPIQTLSGRGGGVSLMPGYSFQKALLSSEEQDQLLLSLQAVSGIQAESREIKVLRDKLQSLFRRPLAENTAWLEVDLTRWGHGAGDRAQFDRLKNAIINRETLHIRYFNAAGAATERDIHPFKLIFKDKCWYLQAYCKNACGYRLFRLPRIASIAPTGEYFSMDFSDAPPIEGPEPPPPPESAITLRFSPGAAYRVCEEFAPDQVEYQADGSATVTTFFPLDNWLYGYLLGFGTDVMVLAPEALRQGLAAHAKKLAAHHKT